MSNIRSRIPLPLKTRVVIDEDRRRDMHHITKHKPFLDARFQKTLFNLRRDIDISSSYPGFEPQLFPVTFHSALRYLIMDISVFNYWKTADYFKIVRNIYIPVNRLYVFSGHDFNVIIMDLNFCIYRFNLVVFNVQIGFVEHKISQ